ncbi:M20/M25/M40 family metallo-hydrolase [Leifsonia kafniensis]
METDDSRGVSSAVGRLIETWRDDILQRIHGYVELETPTSDGPALNTLADALQHRYCALGADVTVVPVGAEGAAGSHVLAELPGRGQLADASTVLLLGHSDTVWPRETLAGMPWSVDGDRVAGPGSFDMKSGLVVIETALEVIRTLNLPHRPVRIAIAADEEIGSPSFQPLLATMLDTVGCALGFESPHPDGALKRGRWGSTRIDLTVIGRESHAALDPDGGVSAIDELVDQLRQVRAIVDAANEGAASPAVLLNVGTISGGTRANVVAGTASALIGLRFLDAAVESTVLEQIRGVRAMRSGAVIDITVLSSRPAWIPTAANDRLLERMTHAAASCGLTLSARAAAGAADTNLPGARGVPTLDGLGPRGEGAHARTESFSIESLLERIALLVAFLTLAE